MSAASRKTSTHKRKPATRKTAKRAPNKKTARKKTATEPPAREGSMRLNRWLSEQGIASRRKADELIEGGSIEVNGEIVLALGTKITDADKVMVNGVPVKRVRRLYYMFNKPKGVLCTDSSRESRMRVKDVIEGQVEGRVYPIGRLDEDSEGLLLLTNDGDFANLIAHPRYGVPKTYMAQISGHLTLDSIQKLRKGVHLAEGKVVPESLRVVKRTKQTTTVRVVLGEGRNREIRRMFAKVGHGVKALKRVQIGEVRLQGVARGRVRPLRRAERDGLLDLVDQIREQGAKHAPKSRSAKPRRRR